MYRKPRASTSESTISWCGIGLNVLVLSGTGIILSSSRDTFVVPQCAIKVASDIDCSFLVEWLLLVVEEKRGLRRVTGLLRSRLASCGRFGLGRGLGTFADGLHINAVQVCKL